MQDVVQNAGSLPPEKVGQAALLTMIVAIVALLLVIGLISVALKRRRARMKANRVRRHGRQLDPWVVAGQRAPTPSADELDKQAGDGP